MSARFIPRLVAIVGGSGSGKTWLAERLEAALGARAARLSLDDFYRDRSHLPPARRARLNFDHPRAIDWARVEQVLADCRRGRVAIMPRYDFSTHTRHIVGEPLQPQPVVLVEGLWLLRRPALRRLFDVRIFLECPLALRLRRRLARDFAERGRSAESVRRQFQETVAPMHDRFVTPQARWADIIFKQPPRTRDVEQLAGQLQSLLNPHPYE